MNRLKPGVDIVLDILNAVAAAQPSSEFVQSLLYQYQERGGLSRKQLEGLYGKASRIETIPPARLATLQAIILKKPVRSKSSLPESTPLYKKDETIREMIDSILKKYPSHKRVVFFRSKFENNEPLSAVELTELQKFYKLLK